MLLCLHSQKSVSNEQELLVLATAYLESKVKSHVSDFAFVIFQKTASCFIKGAKITFLFGECHEDNQNHYIFEQILLSIS